MYLASAEGKSTQEIKRITEEYLKPQLERVAGVAAVEVVGGNDREIKVEVDRKKLDALNLPLTQITDKLKMENLAVPAGHFSQDKQEISVRLTGDLRDAADVANVVVATTASGTQIRLGEIAEVKDGLSEARTRIRANGRDAVAFEIIKQSGTNTVQVVEAAQKKLAEVLPLMPPGFRTDNFFNQATFIEENAHEVEIAIVFGGVMAVLVILIFMLDLRSTFISALALPTSVIGTFWIMSLLGFTLNMMTLLALSLAIGLLIDDAVVVRENIFRHLEAGEPPDVAASKGTSEIALAVLATTLTIVAVFLPVAFMSGIVGQMFRQFGLTISAATLLSLFVAFTLDPMLSARLAVKIDHSKKRNIVVRFMEGMHNSLEEMYVQTLRLSLRYRLITVLIGVGTFAGAAQLAGLMGNEFVPQEDRGQFIIDVELPPGTSLAETARRLLPAETGLKANKNIITVYSKLGPNTEINKAQIRVVANIKTERKETIWDIQDFARTVMVDKLPDAKISIVPPSFIEGLPSGAPMQVQVRGTDLALLERDAAAVESMIKSVPGVSDVQVTYAPGKPEQSVRIDRKKAADMGIPLALIARTLRAALEGEDAGKLRMESGSNKEVKIRVRLRDSDREGVDKLLRLQIPIPPRTVMTPAGPMQLGGFIPLSDVAHVDPESGPQVIERQDRTRQISVMAVPKGRSLGEVNSEVEAKLNAYKFSGDNYYRMDGMVKQMKESGEAFGLAGMLAVLFIFLILASQFESFIHPMTIMLALPMAMIGAWLGLFLTDNTASMGSNIGVILLMGLVTKNGILLVDAALQLQREGVGSVEAIVEAGRKRLRPILMTSAAMILGMMPTATDSGPGSEFRSPMAIAVIGGVLTSTVLTLVVLPSVFLWFDTIGKIPGRIWRKVMGSGNEAKPEEKTAQLEIPPLQPPALEPVGHAKVPQGVAGLLLALLAAGALLWSPQALAAKMPLRDAIDRAIAHNPDLKVAQARIEEAEAQRAKIRTAFYPDVKAVGSYTRNSDEAKFDIGAMSAGLGAALGIPIKIDPAKAPPATIIQAYNQLSATLVVEETLFALSPWLYEKASEQGLGAQRIGIEAAHREVAYRVTEIYHHVNGLDRLIAAASRAVDLSGARIAMIDKKRVAGTESELPLLRAQVEQARAQQDVLRAKLGRRQLLEVLGILLGDAAPEDVELPPAVVPPPGSFDDWVKAGLDQRPDIAARRKALEAQKSLITEAELRWMPILAAQGVLRWSDVKGFTDTNTIWQATVNLVVPIFDRGSRYADLRERRVTYTRLQAEVQKAEQELRAQLRQASHDIELARSVVEIASRQAEIAKRGAEIATKTQAAGLATHLEVDEAETNLRLAEANVERERSNLDLTVLKLLHLTGNVKP
jgi:hydrophobe/amphiphile efflux-1 (HAE1) family protein